MHYLAESQRQHTRPYFLKADAGMTGANFAVAETGTMVVCTNEGNADSSVNLPKLLHRVDRHRKGDSPHRASGCLCPNAVAQRARARRSRSSHRISVHRAKVPKCTSCWSTMAVRNGWEWPDFWYSLKCIRCGACMNTCPVYRRSGGLSYGATYSGPIGVIIDPTFNLRKYSFAPLCLDAQWQLYQRLPGEDQHPRADLQVAADHCRAAPASVRQAGGDEGGGQGPEQSEALSGCRGGCRRRHRASPAVHDVQPVQCMGPAARSAGSAAIHLPPVVPQEPGA